MRRILGKFAVLAIGMSLAAFLCGFCSAHDWVPATCEEPETCSVCGETRGNPLGHQWGKLKRDLYEIPEIDEFYSRTCEICDAVLHPIESGRWTYPSIAKVPSCSIKYPSCSILYWGSVR